MVSIMDRDAFANIPTYLTYGLPNVLIIMMDWFCFQAMALVSGFFGVQQQAVQILLFNFSNIAFQVPMGFKAGICSLIGQHVGAGNAPMARRYYQVLTQFCFLFDLTEFCILFSVRHYIIMIFTNKPVLIEIADSVIWAILIVQFGDFY